MVSNLFSIRFDDSNHPSAEVVVSGRDVPVREYFAGPENALLSHVIASKSNSNSTDHPILLFGPSGVGKSHLLRGIVEQHQAVQPADRVRLQNGSDFCRELSQAHEVGSLADVRQELRMLDVLAIDDVHLLADKSYAQLELLTLLDALQDRQAHVVLTSRLTPSDLPFAPSLKSRLYGGLTVPIQVPGVTTRAAFVRQLANEIGIAIPDNVVDRLAQITPTSIPELRGLVLQLKQAHLEEDKRLDLELVDQVITLRTGMDCPSVRDIIKKVARYFGLTVAEVTGPSRRQTTVLARNTAIFLTRHLREDSFEQIGTYFGGRDHSTIMHAFQKVTKKRDEPMVHAAIVELLQRLGMQHRNI